MTGARKERIITIGDLIREILRRILVVIIAMVVFAALFGGYKYTKDKKSAQALAEAEAAVAAQDSEQTESPLSDEDMEAVNNVLSIQENLDELQEYMNNSLLMQINAFDESKVTLQYYIDTTLSDDVENGAVGDYRQDLINSYQSYVNNGALFSDAVENGAEIDKPYLSELISCNIVGTESNDSDDSASTTVSSVVPTTFNVEIINVDKESCEALADIVAQCMTSYQNKISQSVGQHNLKLLENSYSEGVDRNIWTYKYDRVNAVKTMQDKINDLTADLSSEQQEVLNNQMEAQQKVEEAENSDTPEAVAEISVSISKKYVLLGALVGLVLACLYIMFCYIMRGAINTADDIRELYEISVLGELHLNKKNRRIRRICSGFVGRKEPQVSPEDEAEMLASNILGYCKKQNLKQVLLSCAAAEKDSAWINVLKKAFEEAGIHLEIAPDMAYSAAQLNKLENAELVILTECVRRSTYDRIERELSVCNTQNVPVMGAVVIS